MTMLAYLGHNAHPTPPVIEPGRCGNIMRYSHDRRIVKPMTNAPVLMTVTQINVTKQEENRAEVLRLIECGVACVSQIVKIADVSKGTVLAHIRKLENDGLIVVDRAAKPWSIKPKATASRVSPRGSK